MNLELTAGFAGLGIFLLILVVIYNRLVRLRYQVRSSWSDIDVHLKKRYELVPNLVETVQGYAAHERETLRKVTELRAAAMKAVTPRGKAGAEQRFTETLRSVFLLEERYPSLKADGHFQQLMTQLRQLEDDIEYARRYYNASVRDFNIATGVFPSSLVAAAFAFTPEEFFALADGRERAAVTVSFPQPERS
jgi:LemA protein